jgi:hypothetical protein
MLQFSNEAVPSEVIETMQEMMDQMMGGMTLSEPSHTASLTQRLWGSDNYVGLCICEQRR